MHRAIVLTAVALLLAAGHSDAPAQALDAARLATAPVRYGAIGGLATFAAPVVHWRRPGLMQGEKERKEIEARIVYPLVLHSARPVAAVIVEMFPGDQHRIGVLVVWSDGEARESAVARAPDGTYDADAFKVLFAKPTP